MKSKSQKSVDLRSHALSVFFTEIGRRGGRARAESLSPERRRAIARKASLAAAKVRTAKAKQRGS